MPSMMGSLLLAQKRRYPQSRSWTGEDPTIVETHNLVQRSSSIDMNLVGIARDAKERLDEKFRTIIRRQGKNIESLECVKGGYMLPWNLKMEVFGQKMSILSRLCHMGFQHKECAICSERFKFGENLLHMPCTHRFHLNCLVPWLQNKANCPCCRTSIYNFIHPKR